MKATQPEVVFVFFSKACSKEVPLVDKKHTGKKSRIYNKE